MLAVLPALPEPAAMSARSRHPRPPGPPTGRTDPPRRIDSDDLDRDLAALVDDPMYWRDRDPDYVNHVGRQFERVHGPGGPALGPDGKRRGSLEVPGLRRRPGDDRLSAAVGRDAPNRPGDVAKVQRGLAETGDYAFTAPRERTGQPSPDLDRALVSFQTRKGLEPDGRAAPKGPTVQAMAAGAEGAAGSETSRSRERPAGSDDADTPVRANASGSDPIEAGERTPGSDARRDDKRDCEAIKAERDKALDKLHALNEEALRIQDEVAEIEDAISELQDAEEQLKEMAYDRAISTVLRRIHPAIEIAYQIYGGLRKYDHMQTLENLRETRQTLLEKQVDAVNKVEDQNARVESLTDDYEACKAALTRASADET
jgi:hypothetical protein